MPNLFYQILFLVIAYLIGSIPFGFLIGKSKGIDLREHGSKNIGATNAARVLGKKYFYIILFLDGLKGFIFVFLFRYGILPHHWCLLSPMFYGVAAALGHVFPIYLKFKGGKAVSTSAGAILGYTPMLFVIAIIIFVIVFLIKRYISLASLVATSSIFVSAFLISFGKKEFSKNLFTYPETKLWPFNLWFIVGICLLAIFIFVRHKSNIKRLINNPENKM